MENSDDQQQRFKKAEANAAHSRQCGAIQLDPSGSDPHLHLQLHTNVWDSDCFSELYAGLADPCV